MNAYTGASMTATMKVAEVRCIRARRRSISHKPLHEKLSDYMGQVFQCKAEWARIASSCVDFVTSSIP